MGCQWSGLLILPLHSVQLFMMVWCTPEVILELCYILHAICDLPYDTVRQWSPRSCPSNVSFAPPKDTLELCSSFFVWYPPPATKWRIIFSAEQASLSPLFPLKEGIYYSECKIIIAPNVPSAYNLYSRLLIQRGSSARSFWSLVDIFSACLTVFQLVSFPWQCIVSVWASLTW